MNYDDYIYEMRSSLEEYNFNAAHEITWDQSKKEAIKRVLEIMRAWEPETWTSDGEYGSVTVQVKNNINPRLITQIKKEFNVEELK